MTVVAEACADLEQWLPVSAALIAEPDTTTSRTHTAPASRPPWNPAAANAVYDTLESIRRLHANIRLTVTGRDVPPRPHAVTGQTLTLIVSLSEALTGEQQRETAYQLSRHLTRLLWLPAIDVEEQPRRNLPCPRCFRKMLLYWARSGDVACLGCMVKAQLLYGAVSGEPMLKWADGLVQVAPALERNEP